LVEFVRKHDKRVELARQRQKERNEAIQKKVEEQRRQAIRRNLERLETFEMDEEAEEKHLMDLEQIEAALDAQFGTVNSATTAGDEESGGEDGASGDGSADGEDGGEFRCIVCEKTFKSR
jgi:CRISPR/Cas system-associated endonuclease Cas1